MFIKGSKTKIRCSTSDRVEKCSGCLLPAQCPYNPNFPEGRSGTAAHVGLAGVIIGVDPDLSAIAADHHVDPDDLAMLVANGRRAWRELQSLFPAARSEIHLEGMVADGTTDILSVDVDVQRLTPETIAVGDWKSGWLDTPHTGQLMAYADAARSTYGMPASGYITAVEIHLRQGEYDLHKLTEQHLDGWRSRILQQIEEPGAQYGPGSHCGYCPRCLECGAHRDYLATASTAMIGVTSDKEVSRETLGQLWRRSRDLKRALENYEGLVRCSLLGAPLMSIGDGESLTLESTTKQKLDPLITRRVLREEYGIPNTRINQVLEVSKKSVNKAVAEVSDKGDKGRNQRAALASIKTLGGVSETTHARFKTVQDGDASD